MKKYIFSLILVTLIITPVFGRALTLTELYAQIAQIQAQIEALQNASLNQTTTNCPFTRDLSIGNGANDNLRPDVISLQKWLVGTYLNIAQPTGYFGPLTQSAIKRWQRDNGLMVTGRIGFIERRLLCGQDNNNSSPIVINSVSGPTSIGVGETGTWQVKVTAPAQTNLNYSIDWGDNLVYPTSANSAVLGNVNQTSSFTHSYSQAGTYTIKFRVDNGVVCITAPCTARQSAEASLTVSVGNPIACTMDAYRCPSGVYVGRTGPNCQFVCN